MHATSHISIDAGGVGRVAFDLSHEQFAAARVAASAACTERHRDQAMTVDDVLAMRRLSAICDQLDALAGSGLADTVELTVAGLALLHDALVEWVDAREAQGWMREQDHATHRLVLPLVRELGDLRARAVQVALAGEPLAAATV